MDLDGTLVLSDLLFESFLQLIKCKPFSLLLVPFWLLRGRALLKAEIGARVTLSVQTLPYNGELIQWLKSEKTAGRRLWLCTAANEALAASVADYLKLFDGILASDSYVNLSGANKAAQLVERFGERSFDYCGNERRDIEVWKRARGAIVVNGSDRLQREAARHAVVLRTFPRRRFIALWGIIRALGLRQWTKNYLVLLPLLATHRARAVDSILVALLASLAFCLCASSIHIISDLLSLEAGRLNPVKSNRPFASGAVSIATGLVLAPALICGALVITIFLPVGFIFVLASYYSLALAYCLALKELIVIDTIALASLYLVRIAGGAVAIALHLSPRMLLLLMSLFLSLAAVVRFHCRRSRQRR